MTIDPDADTGNWPAHGREAAQPHRFSSLVRVEVAALSHPGKVRPNNEDHYLVGRLGRYLDVLLTNLPDGEAPGRSGRDRLWFCRRRWYGRRPGR